MWLVHAPITGSQRTIPHRSGPVLAVRTGLGTTCSHFGACDQKVPAADASLVFSGGFIIVVRPDFLGNRVYLCRCMLRCCTHYTWAGAFKCKRNLSTLRASSWSFEVGVAQYKTWDVLMNQTHTGLFARHRASVTFYEFGRIMLQAARFFIGSTCLPGLLWWKDEHCRVLSKFISVFKFFRHIVTLFWYLACCNIRNASEARMPLWRTFWMLHDIMAGGYEEVKFLE